ncbi:hypothetical protein [Vibrio europaeus]|uniref:hypothetical protein n=1 Tax=Vibrio europaeus TaxID=300876 RepID=UPI00148BC0EE|nr:hypothetical protein [Vibrio europaeus]NOH23867.1 hypothetical protein [Vibrio europaeus]
MEHIKILKKEEVLKLEDHTLLELYNEVDRYVRSEASRLALLKREQAPWYELAAKKKLIRTIDQRMKQLSNFHFNMKQELKKRSEQARKKNVAVKPAECGSNLDTNFDMANYSAWK